MTKILIHPTIPKVANVPTPPSGFVILYPKPNGVWFVKRDDGSEIPFSIDISEIIDDTESRLNKTWSSQFIKTLVGDLENQIISILIDIYSELDTKQEQLISGDNFKTINNQSLFGKGNINIEGGSGTNFQIIQVEGGSYPTPTPEQLAGSILYIGFDYPVGMAVRDRFQKLISRPIFEPTTNITAISFTANWLTPQYIGEPTELDSAPLYDELVNYYIIERSEDNFSTIAETRTTLGLSYSFDSVNTVEQYVRVRAVQEIQEGITLKSDFSDSIIVDLTAAPTPVLDLSPNLYLAGGTYADQGSEGGTWTSQGTITVDANGYLITSASNAVIYKDLASPLNIGSNGTEDYSLVLWANLPTNNSSQAFLTMIASIFTDSTRAFWEARSTDSVRFSRVASATSEFASVRLGTLRKYIIERRGGNFLLKIDPEIGGTSAFSAGLSRPSGDANMNIIAIGATVSGATPISVGGNPLIEKFAFWRGTIPTHDEIAAL